MGDTSEVEPHEDFRCKHSIFEDKLVLYTVKSSPRWEEHALGWETKMSSKKLSKRVVSYFWDEAQCDIVLEGISPLAKKFPNLPLDEIADVSNTVVAHSRVLYFDPAKMGLVTQDLNGFVRDDQMTESYSVELDKFRFPVWQQDGSNLVWAAPGADLSEPGTLYLVHKIFTEDDDDGKKVVWRVRQALLDIPQEDTFLMEIAWDDVKGLKAAAETVLASDVEANSCMRALTDQDTMAEYQLETQFWKDYEEAWEYSKPLKARVSRSHIQVLLDKTVRLKYERVLSPFYTNNLGFGGSKTPETNRRAYRGKMSHARNSIVQVHLGWHVPYWDVNRDFAKAEKTFDEFVALFAKAIERENVGHLVRYNKADQRDDFAYVVVKDVSKARKHIPLVKAEFYLHSKNFFRNWRKDWANFVCESYDATTGKWVSV